MLTMSGTSLFARYDASAGVDEMFTADGTVHPSYAFLRDALTALGEDEFRTRSEGLARAYLDQGVTFDYAGEERPFPIDAVPRVISAEEWAQVSVGVAQRVRALEHFLDDCYTDRRAIADGVLPAHLVESSRYLVDRMQGYRPPNNVRIHIAGIDVVRDGSGGFRVLEDNVRTPSGVSYVLSNRRAMVRSFPELFSRSPVRRVDEYRRRRRTPRTPRRWSYSLRAVTTAPTSSTRSWPGPWGSNSSRRAICWSATTACT
jgi:uncharacterized circularly permuted ATP-grasp superfamily protein